MFTQPEDNCVERFYDSTFSREENEVWRGTHPDSHQFINWGLRIELGLSDSKSGGSPHLDSCLQNYIVQEEWPWALLSLDCGGSGPRPSYW